MIYTSSYSAASRLGATKSLYHMVRISVTKPDWAEADDALPVLYPDSHMLWDYKAGRIDEREYTQRYIDELDCCSERVVEAVRAAQERAAGKPLLLLCWCGRGKFCHRHIFAEWWENLTGEPVQEL